jgi:hypothetical protein
MVARGDRVEQAMVVTISLIASFMFMIANSYPAGIRFFPQVTAGIVVLSGLFILMGNKFSIGGDSETSLTESITSTIPEETSDKGKSADITPDMEEIRADELYLFGLIALYVAGGFLVGLFWVTPLFVFAYTRWNALSWKETVALSAASVFIPYAIMFYLNINYMTGYLQTVIL